MRKVYLVGAGPGDPDLLTRKAWRLLNEADLIVYAGSLVPEEMLAPLGAEKIDSAPLSLEEIVAHLERGYRSGGLVVRLHSGDPSLYGAIHEEMRALEERGIPFEIVPGVSSFLAGAAALACELTVPEVSQTVIITRTAGRTPVPESLRELARHRATMVLFLSASLVEKAVEELLSGGYSPQTPAACVYRVGWPEMKIIRTTLAELPAKMARAGIKKQALIYVGEVLSPAQETRSRLYDPSFSHGARRAKKN
ncbi:MAG: precorrin-4 C(11)-methyltransferase [Thermodesulfobacteria bacterium]|nr:precorrin-4 C(11)-methyltransferase [Thermodesulfobacteriota bacterium]